MSGRVTLVGGGPGDADLLTIAAVRALATADVVLYDRLAPHEALADLAPGADLVDVGKRPGHHALPQSGIEALLVEHARAGRHAVRLKGGDPYVLGRGGEEVLACRRAGVPVAVVPGITSAIAVPAAAGIPLTHRGVSHLFTVVSGHAPSPRTSCATSRSSAGRSSCSWEWAPCPCSRRGSHATAWCRRRPSRSSSAGTDPTSARRSPTSAAS
ncbi:hypothetical protein GCM10025870_32370 [Agromyces marinus]|uniref:uroporphyrinogen-III C-methyltransferase n=1 Tax=Agromyces marinus TaxID=1389020 RepID=A0ABN6YFF9_9MICO|nr:hypothetical protein GCM10025870_32370 [Agromyces marinus]